MNFHTGPVWAAWERVKELEAALKPLAGNPFPSYKDIHKAAQVLYHGDDTKKEPPH